MLNKCLLIALLVIFTCQNNITVHLTSPIRLTNCIGCNPDIFNNVTNKIQPFVFIFNEDNTFQWKRADFMNIF